MTDLRALARLMDHTLLRPEATGIDVDRLCDEARQWGFVAVCVNPCHVAQAVRRLQNTPVAVATVIGFPLGATTTRAKAGEAREAVELGARELDMVMTIGAAKSGEWGRVGDDVSAVVQAAPAALVKVILETALLTDAEKEQACRAAVQAGAHFVKTSTGFGPGGATVEDVVLMRRVVGNACQVKAAGGIRDLKAVQHLVAAGADRVGTSRGVAIMREAAGPPADSLRMDRAGADGISGLDSW